jgi:lipopolysaccharide export system permease protein
MFGRLLATAAGLGAVIAIEQILYKSPMLYDLVMGGVLSPYRVLLVWICLLPVIFYHAGPEIVSVTVAWRYHQWMENNEIVALRSAGQSCRRIAAPGIMVAVIACLVCAINSTLLMPPSWSKIEDIRMSASATVSTALLQPGRAQQLAPDVSIIFSHRGTDGETLEDALISDHRADISARHARVVELDGNDILQLQNGAYLFHDQAGFRQVTFNTLSLPLRSPVAGDKVTRAPGYYEQPITKLLNPPAEILRAPAERAAWLTEGNRRIINPLLCIGNTILVMGLLIPNRHTRFRQRALFGVAIVSGLATNALPDVLISAAIRSPGLLPLLYLLPVIPLLVGSLLLLRADLALPVLGLDRSRPSAGPAAGLAERV